MQQAGDLCTSRVAQWLGPWLRKLIIGYMSSELFGAKKLHENASILCGLCFSSCDQCQSPDGIFVTTDFLYICDSKCLFWVISQYFVRHSGSRPFSVKLAPQSCDVIDPADDNWGLKLTLCLKACYDDESMFPSSIQNRRNMNIQADTIRYWMQKHDSWETYNTEGILFPLLNIITIECVKKPIYWKLVNKPWCTFL